MPESDFGARERDKYDTSIIDGGSWRDPPQIQQMHQQVGSVFNPPPAPDNKVVEAA
jgi:hypothetical protein